MMSDHETSQRFLSRVDTLRRYSYWIFSGGCACAAGALVVSLFLPSIYRATTYVLISESKIGVDSRDSNIQQMAMLPTYVPFVDNDALIDKSLKKFHLDQEPYNLTVDSFRRKSYLDVRVPKSTRLLELNIEFPDARLAAELVNDIAQGAVAFNDVLNATDTTATQEFLKERLDLSRDGLAEAANRRLKVREQARIEDLEKELSILLAEKDRLSTRLQQLRLDLAQDESRSRALEKALADEPKTVLLQRSVTSDRFTELAAEKAFPAGTPLAVTEESLNQTREGIRQEFVRATVSSAAESAGIQVGTIRLERANHEITQLLSRITGLRSEIETADQEYALAIEAIKNANREYQAASVTVSSKSQDIKQISPALVPERPVRPRILLNTVMGFLFGVLVFGGVVIAFQSYREVYRRSSFTGEEAEVAIHRR